MAMPKGYHHACMVSFSQLDRDADRLEFKQFLEMLHRQLSANAHTNSRGESYYLLNEHAPAGNFRELLNAALRQCVCLLSLYSPNYWGSVECSQERSFFLGRNLSSRITGTSGLDCFAIPWRMLPVDARGNSADRVIPADSPAHLKQLSYFRREVECPTIYNEGLCTVMKRGDPRSVAEVELYVSALADEISRVIERLKPGLIPRRPMRHGKLYVLAAGPAAIEDKLLQLSVDKSEAVRRRSELYTAGGGPDWHPFTPGDPIHSIGQIVDDVIRKEMKDEIVELLKDYQLTENLRRVIEEAATRQEYAIVVVDPLSYYHFEHMRSLLAGLDDPNYRYTNMVLVLVRSPSLDVAEDSEQLNETTEDLRASFGPHAKEWYFMGPVASEDEFTKQLKGRIVELRAAMQTTPRRSVDFSGPKSLVRL